MGKDKAKADLETRLTEVQGRKKSECSSFPSFPSQLLETDSLDRSQLFLVVGRSEPRW